MKPEQIPPHTVLTGTASVGWILSVILRAFIPEFQAAGMAADGLMTTVAGYWFTQQKKAKGTDDVSPDPGAGGTAGDVPGGVWSPPGGNVGAP